MIEEFVHNNIKSKKIRNHNEQYNNQWISKYRLIGFEPQNSFTLDVNKKQIESSNPYMLVWLRNLDRLKYLLPKHFTFEKYHLIDVGCGCGISTIYLNEKYNFKSVSGFDFSTQLINKAKKNNINFYNKKNKSAPIKFVVADAINYEINSEPTILFLFNPFSLNTLKLFIKNNLKNLSLSKSLLFYVNDLFINEIKEFSRVIKRNNFYNISISQF
mgnify:CR=1 FL=1|tara:strand:- start:248 stop:892 length:645 start_codon:yes stop_codon:yes gene_type:complete